MRIHQFLFGREWKFSKNSTTQEGIRMSRLKKDFETSTKKTISNQKLNQCLKTYKMRTSQQKVLNFVLISDGSWKAKNILSTLKWRICSSIDIFKSAKRIMKHFTPGRYLRKLLLMTFIARFLRKKISNEQFSLREAKISLDEIIKSISFQTNGCYF